MALHDGADPARLFVLAPVRRPSRPPKRPNLRTNRDYSLRTLGAIVRSTHAGPLITLDDLRERGRLTSARQSTRARQRRRKALSPRRNASRQLQRRPAMRHSPIQHCRHGAGKGIAAVRSTTYARCRRYFLVAFEKIITTITATRTIVLTTTLRSRYIAFPRRYTRFSSGISGCPQASRLSPGLPARNARAIRRCFRLASGRSSPGDWRTHPFLGARRCFGPRLYPVGSDELKRN
jgi:hypothetical protein